MLSCQTLSASEVIEIYNRLVEDSKTSDPIDPAGIKSNDLLESAVSRQHTALGGTSKYPDSRFNAATLAFGICTNHPFHNGNKRAALVSMLVHLDKNNLILQNIDQSEITKLMVKIADRKVHEFHGRLRRRKTSAQPGDTDFEVVALADWLDANTRVLDSSERSITFRDLKRLLRPHGYFLENPNNNAIEVIRYTEKSNLFGKKTLKPVHILTIGYPGDSRIVTLADLKRLRKSCKLTAEDGCDSRSFYDNESLIESYINHYRKTLRQLRNK